MIDPPILILDDALSAVDTDTEAAILRGLAGVMRTRTAILIAHRASTIRHADHIVVLDDGPDRRAGQPRRSCRRPGPMPRCAGCSAWKRSWPPRGDPAASDDDIIGKAYDARLMRRLLGYLRPHWRSVLLGLVVIVATSLLQLVQPWLTKVDDEHIARGDLAGVGRVAALFLAVLAGVFVLEFAQTWISQTIGQGIMFEMRMAIYGHLQRVDVAFYHDRHAVGRLMTRVTSDVDALNDLFSAGVVAVFGDASCWPASSASCCGWTGGCNVTFSVLPLIVIMCTQWFRRHVRESYRRVRGWVARINAFLQENLTGMATVQLFRRETLNFERFEAINRGHRDANVEAIFYYYAVFYPAIEAVAALAAALIIVAGGHWVGTGTLTIGALVAFLQHAQRFFRPISDMSEKFNLLQAAMASSERIFTLLDTPVTIASPAAATPRASGSRGHIVFDHVWFAYGVDAATAADAMAGAKPGGSDVNWVLRDVSFDVPAGQRVGIVGATGAGKTTIISLLLRFYDVQRGRILVDGVDIRELDLAELRGICGLVLQDVYLFSGSISTTCAWAGRS